MLYFLGNLKTTSKQTFRDFVGSSYISDEKTRGERADLGHQKSARLRSQKLSDKLCGRLSGLVTLVARPAGEPVVNGNTESVLQSVTYSICWDWKEAKKILHTDASPQGANLIVWVLFPSLKFIHQLGGFALVGHLFELASRTTIIVRTCHSLSFGSSLVHKNGPLTIAHW